MRRSTVLIACALAGVLAPPAPAAVTHGTLGDRTYRLFVPDTPAAPVAPAARRPVVFLLHGGGRTQDGDAIAAQTQLELEAAARGWIVIAPDARGGSFRVAGYQRDRGAALHARQDLELLHDLLARVGDRHRIDRASVTAVGFSNGGFMAYALACERRPLVAAIAVAGTTETLPRCANAGRRPVALLHLHARDDERLPIARGVHGWPSPRATVRRWARRNRGRAPAELREYAGGGHSWLPGMTPAAAQFLTDVIASRRTAQ